MATSPACRPSIASFAACGRRLAITVEDDDVDRSQIRQQLAMTPAERLASVTNLSRTLATARRVT